MNTIWKFPLVIADQQAVEVPRGAVFLSVAMQGSTLCAWAEVDSEAPKDTATIWIKGTGNAGPNLPTEARFLGTVQERVFVWHVFVEE